MEFTLCYKTLLSTAKVAIPEDPGIDFVIKLINRGLTQVEYFG